MAGDSTEHASGSREAVALELWKYLRRAAEDPETQLQFFAKCRRAAHGIGEFKTPPARMPE